MKYHKLLSTAYYTGMALVLIGVITQLSGNNTGGYILLAGALPIVVVRIYNRAVALKDHERINTILLFSSLLLVAASFAIFYGKNYWIVFIFTASLIDIYASFRRIS